MTNILHFFNLHYQVRANLFFRFRLKIRTVCNTVIEWEGVKQKVLNDLQKVRLSRGPELVNWLLVRPLSPPPPPPTSRQ
jgi:hypothetical protein